mmetsp:Transcript_43019/g.130971  ORF Transcript_43019/g.130971 Transcript_43019/m.130971 type:complete len:250 (+) Transcript_43019:790-1539(+)
MSVSAFVKEGLGVVEREQCRIGGLGEVIIVHDHGNRFHPVGAIGKIPRLRTEFRHPRTGTLVRPGVIVRQEHRPEFVRPAVLTLFGHLVHVHVRMISLHVVPLDVCQSEQLVRYRHDGVRYGVEAQVRLEGRFVEGISSDADPLGVISPIPRTDAPLELLAALLDEFFESLPLAIGRLLRAYPHVLQQFHHVFGGARHGIPTLILGERIASVQVRLTFPQFQNLRGDGQVVPFGMELSPLRPRLPRCFS